MEHRIKEALKETNAETLVEQMRTVLHQAQDGAAKRVKAADRVVRDHPYQTIGIAFGVGLLIGLIARRNSH